MSDKRQKNESKNKNKAILLVRWQPKRIKNGRDAYTSVESYEKKEPKGNPAITI